MANLNNSNKKVFSNWIYCGLVPGYQGEGNQATPANAAEAVAAALGARHEVFPGVCVYHTDWGCPVGGEPVGAYRVHGTAEEILSEAEKLRKELKQSTLSVCLPNVGEPTVGFFATLHMPLLEAAAKWQEAAARHFSATGTYVSCGMLQNGNETFISAEANPAFVKDLVAWEKLATQICHELDVEEFVMAKTNFNYLKDAE